ncbi:MAG: hypothetical protein IKC49_03865 [Clostridia bacterium]|nr:hypothetical protein [Clostridia bacterium]
MKVKVYMQTINEKHTFYADDSNDCVLADEQNTNYQADRFIFKVGTMVKDWPNELINEKILDGLTYKIVINKKDQELKYTFKNKFPEDIYRLDTLVDEVLGDVKNVD